MPADLDDSNTLRIRRVIYDGFVDELPEPQILPLDAPEHAQLVERLRTLDEGYNGRSTVAMERHSILATRVIATCRKRRRRLVFRLEGSTTSDIRWRA